MPRCHGSYIGHVPTPTASAASGVWRLHDAQENLASGNWPSQPAVPGAPTATQRVGGANLSWAALTTSPAVTDYGIQYSTDDGETWTTYTDSVSSSTTATLTGLANGTYIFRLFGVNALGNGPYGSASNSVEVVAAVPPVPDSDLVPRILLHFDGLNDSTDFVDSSPFQRTVSQIGDALIGTEESRFGGSSMRLAAGGGVSVPADASLDLGSSDWTIECFYFRSGPSGYALGGQWGAGGNAWFLGPNGFYLAGNFILGWDEPATGEWHHVAVVRSGDTVTAYMDGIPVGTTPFASAVSASTSFVGVGRDEAGNATLEGYIDEFRMVIGQAVYTGPFPPRSEPFADPVNAALLLHFDGLNDSTTFVDSSVNQYPVSQFGTGDAKIGTEESRFGYASLRLDVDGGVSVPADPGLDLGNSDWTIECFFYMNTEPGEGLAVIASQWGEDGYSWLLAHNAFYVNNAIAMDWATPSVGQWHHIAINRAGNALKAYIDGQQVDATTLVGSVASSTSVLAIGKDADSVFDTLDGYVDEFRMVIGQSVYPIGCLPPEHRFPDPWNAPRAVYPTLMLRFAGGFTDESGFGQTINAVGDAEISTTQYKFGQGSAKFSGAGYLDITEDSSLLLSGSDWTLEMWVLMWGNYTGYIAGNCFSGENSVAQNGWAVRYYAPTGTFHLFAGSDPPWDIAAPAVIGSGVVLNQWYHISVVQQGQEIRTYLDGVPGGTVTTALSIANPTGAIRVGVDSQCYVDNLLIVKNAALRSGAFTPPITSF